MLLVNYEVKKGFVEKTTTKDASGSYDTHENSAEVTMTFTNEGTPIDVKEANDRVRQQAKDLINDDPDWIKNGPKETPHQQSISGELGKNDPSNKGL